MTKIEVATQVSLNGTGRWGAAFLIIGPIASAILYPLLGRALASGSPDAILILMGLLGSCVAFLFGIVMIIIGREYSHHVEIQRE